MMMRKICRSAQRRAESSGKGETRPRHRSTGDRRRNWCNFVHARIRDRDYRYQEEENLQERSKRIGALGGQRRPFLNIG